MTAGFRLAALVLPGVLWWSTGTDSQKLVDPSEETPIFLCGIDQVIPEIPLNATNVILASDGRLYSPCGLGGHSTDHREIREATLIGRARYSGDFVLRFRGAQAMARNATRPRYFPTVSGSTEPNVRSLEFVVTPLAGLGGLVAESNVTPACDGEVQVVDGTTNPRRWQAGRLFFMLTETGGVTILGSGPPPRSSQPIGGPVTREGAYAIGVQLLRPGVNEQVTTAAARSLAGCLARSGNNDLSGLIAEAIGLARYGGEDQVSSAEALLTRESLGNTAKLLGVVKGLEALIRQHPKHQIAENTRVLLRRLATSDVGLIQPEPLDTAARIRRLAMMALTAAGDRDYATLRLAAVDPDWQVRRLVAAGLSLSNPEMASLGNALASDPVFLVRYEFLSAASRLATQTRECAPIVPFFNDSSPIVVMRAMDALATTCTDLDEVVRVLGELADGLRHSGENSWHIPSRALSTLARLRPAEARTRMSVALEHLAWQVRAAAAAMTVGLADESTAATLALDREPNVQTAALDALSQMQSRKVVPLAIAAIKTGNDYQLLRKAALVLKDLPAEAKADASEALLGALERLTGHQIDASSAARIAMLERLAQTLTLSRTSDLVAYVRDYDDDVSVAARRAYGLLTQSAPEPGPRWGRYPFQPTPAALSALPAEAELQLEDGTVRMQLLPDVAPVTVARFAALVARGYYKGRTFHRVIPNFIVQGGSPGANDYASTTRYMRDEVGPQAVHVRGAVGMSNRGIDKGDGQFFIDIVDLPHLDRNYTVFAYVTSGMEFVDRLLDGARIVRISTK